MKVPSSPKVEALLVALAMIVLVAVNVPRLARAPLEGHSWRQSLAASVTRSYVCGQPLLEPRLDACGSANSGVQAMELPLYAWLMARFDGLFGAHLGERLVSLLGGLATMLGLALLARRTAGVEAAKPAAFGSMLGRRPAPAAVGAAPLAVAAAVSSALFLFYAATLIPDVTAYGIALLGGWIVTRGSRRAIVAGSLVMSLGFATKLIALPIAAYTGMQLLQALFGDRDRTSKRFGDLAWHVALALALPIAWYAVWNGHLAASEPCQLFWTKVEHPLRSVTSALPGQVHARLGELFGSWWRLGTYVALLLLMVLRLGAALPTLALWGATSVLWATLGWHHDAHEYDTLIFLVPAAVTLGGALGALTAHVKPEPALAMATAIPLLAAVPGVWSARKQLPKREKVEQPALAFLARDLDRPLAPGDPVTVPDAGGDARVSYYAARPTFNGPLDCEKPSSDAVLTLAPHAPVCGRTQDAVYLPDATLTFGLRGRSPLDVRSKIAGSFEGTSMRDVPGLGTFLGADAVHRPEVPPRVDLWFVAKRANGAAPAIAGGKAEKPSAPVPEGAIYVIRVTLPAPGPYRVSAGDFVVEGTTEEVATPEMRCVK